MHPNLIIHNAKIYTVDPAQPWAEAIACAQGQLVAVGSEAEVLALAGPATRCIDAGGRLVLPGLIDAHVHFLAYAVRRQQVNLFGLTDFEEVRRRVSQAVALAAPGQWVQGYGWDENHWTEAPPPTWLNELAPDTPVVLARVDMHTWWVNQKVMELAGINRETPDPPESRIERNAEGRPTGLLREWNAIRLVEPLIPEPDEATLHRWLRQAITEAHRLGLTAIHDQRVEREGRQSLRLWQALERQGELTLRVQANLAADFLPEVAALGLQPGFGSERLWLGHVKLFADGTLGSRTAHMLAPFEGEPDNVGLVVTEPGQVAELAAQAEAANFSLSIHAIGDRAVREMIDVLSEFPPDLSAGSGRRPHRIEHVQVLDPADLPRLAAANIVASMQPVHLMLDWATADRLWGRRARLTYAFRSLLDHG
ncbi:MAG: amidohydrolase, partial [Anaerolineae bacterium]|nr:amidohydrolase [Anaerolineae bacterium]